MTSVSSEPSLTSDAQWLLKHRISERFGMRLAEFCDWAFFSTNKNEVSVIRSHHLPPTHMKAGSPTLEWDGGAGLPVLSRATQHFIGSRATRNILNLRAAPAELFLGHGHLDRDPSILRQPSVFSGPVILQHGEATLGMAFLNNDGSIMDYSRHLGLSSYPAVERLQNSKFH